MPDLGKYAFEVMMSYGIGLGLIGVLVLWTWVQARRAKAALARIEKDG